MTEFARIPSMRLDMIHGGKGRRIRFGNAVALEVLS